MGFFSWTKRKAYDAKSYGEKIVGAEEIRRNYDYIVQMAKIVLSPKYAKEYSRKETFLEAQKRLNVSDADIVKNHRNMVYGFYVSLFFGIVCFLIVIYNLFFLKNLLGALTSLSILAVCLANSFRYSFRAFQIKHKKLCSVKEWWDRADEWFPKLP